MPSSSEDAKLGSPWRPPILVLDDEWSILERIKSSLGDTYEVDVAGRAEEALKIMREKPFEVVLTDVRMPDMDGLTLVSEMKARYPETQYILMTAFSDIEDTISAIRLGVADYLRKPFTMGEVRHALNRCLEQRRLKREVASLKAGGQIRFGDIISQDPRMREVCRLADTVAPTEVTVLISGETGTGKGIMARALHNSSPRRERPFVEINCAAIPTNLIESELFGHERGSFTGAVNRKIGRVESADGGTILLDEIGEMPLDMQAKLLKFIQELSFTRVGGTKELNADVRVLAATNRDLQKMVSEKTFREDLFYRLHVIQLHLPPLRERPRDILPLAELFRARFNIKYGKDVEGFTPQVEETMMRHSWMGNVRELEHTVERGLLLCRGRWMEELLLAEMPGAPPTYGVASGVQAPPPDRSHSNPPSAAFDPDAQEPPQPAAGPPDPDPEVSLADYLGLAEKSYLAALLAHTRGRIGKAAEAAQLNPKTLYLKMSRYGLRKEDYRNGYGPADDGPLDGPLGGGGESLA